MITRLEIAGMTCAECVDRVSTAIRALPGVERVLVSLDSGVAEVEGAVSQAQLRSAVEAQGYQLISAASHERARP